MAGGEPRGLVTRCLQLGDLSRVLKCALLGVLLEGGDALLGFGP